MIGATLRLRRRADLGRLRHVLRPRDAAALSRSPRAGSSAPTCSTPRCCSGSPAPGTCCTGTSTCTRSAWLLVGSIPGVLLGSHLSIRVPERALRIAFGFVLDPLRDQAREDARRDPIIEVALVLGVIVLLVWSGRQRQAAPAARPAGPGARPRIESPRRGPGPVDGVRPRPARGDCRCVRAHRAREARAVADLRARTSTPVFSPAGTVKPVAHIAFRLRPRERLDVWIEDTARAQAWSTLAATPERRSRGSQVDLVWDGLTPRRASSCRTACTSPS